MLKAIEMRVRLLGLENAPKDTEPPLLIVRATPTSHVIADLTAISEAG